jgi:hypothetical protein
VTVEVQMVCLAFPTVDTQGEKEEEMKQKVVVCLETQHRILFLKP